MGGIGFEMFHPISWPMEKPKKDLDTDNKKPLKPEELPFRHIITTDEEGPTLEELEEQNEKELNKLHKKKVRKG